MSHEPRTINLAGRTGKLVLRQGQSRRARWYMTDSDGDVVSLTGWSGPVAWMREEVDSGTVHSFACAIETNEVEIQVPSAVVDAATFVNGYWQFQIVDPDGDTQTRISGPVVIRKQVASS